MPDEPSNEEYELLPHKEVEELKGELSKLKSFDVQPTKKLIVNLVELNTKIDKLTNIFEEASRQITLEEGGLTFHDKMKPLVDRMNKILQQNSEIAEGIVAVADLVKDLRNDLERAGILPTKSPFAGISPAGIPTLPRPPLPQTPPLPPPPRKA